MTSLFRSSRSLTMLCATAALVAFAPAPAAFAQEESSSAHAPPEANGQIKGMISAHEGSHVTVKTSDGATVDVMLTDATKVVATSGALNLQRRDRTTKDLVQGLPVTIDIVANAPGAHGPEAVTITFKQGDLKTAHQIAAGTAKLEAENKELQTKNAKLEEQNQDTRKRLSEANQYVEKSSATVLFASGSATLSADAKTQLKGISQEALKLKGYVVSVTGYADPTGNAQANQKLSARRASATIQYLQKYCGLRPERVMAGDALGDVHQVGDTSTSQGLAQNRRVVVKVLTNKGLEGL